MCASKPEGCKKPKSGKFDSGPKQKGWRFWVAPAQGWEFAHQFSEQIARFCEKMSNSLKKMSNLLTLLNFGERPKQFTHIAHQKRGNERITHFLI